MTNLARVLVPGALAGVAIGLIANIIIGGIFYSLLNGGLVATLAGTLAASVVGIVLGAVTIYTKSIKCTADITRSLAAGWIIGVVCGFLGSIDSGRLEGLIGNVVLLSAFTGVVLGAAGLRGTGGKFFSNHSYGDSEDLGAFGRALDGAQAGFMIGVACAIPAVLLYGKIFIFLRKIDPTRKMDQSNRIEFINVVSANELLIGAILGIVIGAAVGLALSGKRARGFLMGTLVGVVIGLPWVMPEIIIIAFNPLLGGPLGGELPFSALAIATVAGAAFRTLSPDSRMSNLWELALISAGIGVLLVLSHIVIAGAYILNDMVAEAASAPERSTFETFLDWNRNVPLRLFINVVSGVLVALIVGIVTLKYAGVASRRIISVVLLTNVSLSLKGSYLIFLANVFLLGSWLHLPTSVYSSGYLPLISTQIVSNVMFGALVGVIVAAILKLTASRSNPDRILSDQPTT